MRTMTEINGDISAEERIAVQALQDAMNYFRRVSGKSCLLYAFKTEEEAEAAMKNFDAALGGTSK